jgi:hypothetical protein
MTSIPRSSRTITSPYDKKPRYFNIADTISKAKTLQLIFESIKDQSDYELSTMVSEVSFFEGTLKKLKSAVSSLRVAREGTIRDYISERFSHVSCNEENDSGAGSDIYDKQIYRRGDISSPYRVSSTLRHKN